MKAELRISIKDSAQKESGGLAVPATVSRPTAGDSLAPGTGEGREFGRLLT
jgi:hypothetical protein